MDKLRMTTADGVQDNVEKIALLFPDCVTETRDNNTGRLVHKVDFDKLRQELSGSIVSDREERYQFTWPDKSKAILLANAPVNAALRPCREESVDFDNTKNLYIEGDNLDVLKCLKETYLHQVKMIYIDPPYNTGSDFVYEDDFAESAEDYRSRSGQYDEQGNRLVTNTESNGRFHTDWLNMIYPRLKVARDLLTEDGVIFISIDGNEGESLRKICDGIFGENNNIAQLVIENNPRGRQSDMFFATSHEYLLCYAKNVNFAVIKGMALTSEQISEYKYEDERGLYRLLGLRQRGVASLREDRPDMFFPIWVNPEDGKISLNSVDSWEKVIPKKSDGREGRWMWGKQKCINDSDRLVARLIKNRGEYDIFVKDYLDRGDNIRTRKLKTVWIDKTLNNQVGTQEVKAVLGGDYMSFPKSTKYIKTIIQISSKQDSLILDFFSGSATTAHAVMQLNAEDGGNRKFIMVQLPELTDEKSEAYKAGYKTICEIGKERIRRAGCKIKEESPLTTQNLDTGFRVLKLDSTNMEDIYYAPGDINQANLFSLVDNVKPDRTSEDLLFQVMLELGATLDSKIEHSLIDGKTVWNVADGYIVACFDKDVTDDVVKAIAKMQPQYAVLRDTSMANDSTATNFEQIFKTYSPNTTTKIL